MSIDQYLFKDFEQITEEIDISNYFSDESHQSKPRAHHGRYQTKTRIKPNVVMVIGVVICVAFICITIIFSSRRTTENNHIYNGDIQIQTNNSELIDENIDFVVATLKSNGFSNIEIFADPDLRFDIFNRSNSVKMISINGKCSFNRGEWFNPNSKIIITYHTYK